MPQILEGSASTIWGSPQNEPNGDSDGALPSNIPKPIPPSHTHHEIPKK